MKIFLDAGHNYDLPDIGASVHGLREQDVTFQVADKTREILERHGVIVCMSRKTPTDILGRTVNESLNIRSNMSNSFGADYFVSIHCNAGGGVGTESYISATGGKRHELALRIHRQLVGLGLRDRGVKVGNFAVLRNTKAPAVLVELGFLDSANDNDILRNRQFELAEAVAKGILEQCGIEYKGGEEMAKINIIRDSNGTIQLEINGAKPKLPGLFLADNAAGTTQLAHLLREIGHEVSWVDNTGE